MAWGTSRPNGGATAAKYRTPEHRAAVKAHRDALQAAGSGSCAEPVCLYRSRLIVPGMALDLCHDRTTGAVIGLGHRKCNRSEGSRYARSVQTASPLRW